MQVASKDLCQKLYEVSGWGSGAEDATEKIWFEGKDGYFTSVPRTHYADNNTPDYDLEYILTKLPAYITIKHFSKNDWKAEFHRSTTERTDHIETVRDSFIGEQGSISSTPTDAAVKLALALFENGVLTKGGRDE